MKENYSAWHSNDWLRETTNLHNVLADVFFYQFFNNDNNNDPLSSALLETSPEGVILLNQSFLGGIRKEKETCT